MVEQPEITAPRMIKKVVSQSPSKTVRNARAAAKRPELLRRIRSRERRQEREGNLVTQQQGRNIATNQKRALPVAKKWRNRLRKKGKSATVQRVKILSAAPMIALAVNPLIIPQVTMGLVGIAGLGMELAGESIFWGLFSDVIPGDILWGVATGVNMVIGIISMTAAFSILSMRGVKCLRGYRVFAFILCFAGYIIPVANLIPWVWVWYWYLLIKAK